MEMTYEQRQDYNKLTEYQKEVFDFTAKMNPDFTFEQLIKKVIIDDNMNKTLRDGGKNVDPQDPTIIELILIGAKEALKRFSTIGRGVFIAIDNAIRSIKEKIDSGMQTIGDLFAKIIGNIS